jgi:membrane protease YdiL (CAAX protease family)
MSTIRPDVGIDSRFETAAVALALTVAGTVAGTVGAVGLGVGARAVLPAVTDAVYVVTSRGVQVGFAAFALAYLRYTGSWERYARFRRPTWRDAAAVLGAFVALFVLGSAAEALVAALGLAGESATSGRNLALHTRPVLWPLVVLVWFGFATPAEELFYRGIVQGRLRESFSPAAAVAVGAACFALSHVAFAGLSGAGGDALATTALTIFAGGLVFCGLYEVTDNLVPVAVFHGLTWLHPFHAVEALLAVVV